MGGRGGSENNASIGKAGRTLPPRRDPTPIAVKGRRAKHTCDLEHATLDPSPPPSPHAPIRTPPRLHVRAPPPGRVGVRRFAESRDGVGPRRQGAGPSWPAAGRRERGEGGFRAMGEGALAPSLRVIQPPWASPHAPGAHASRRGVRLSRRDARRAAKPPCSRARTGTRSAPKHRLDRVRTRNARVQPKRRPKPAPIP